MERWRAWLASAQCRRVLFLLGGLLALPSVSRRLLFDDHLQAVLRMPKPPIDGLVHTSIDLFTFGKPGSVNDTFIERGIIVPWWTYPGYRVSFFRPLSAFTHVLDGWLWPQSPMMAHVQSIVWYLLLLALASRVYSQLLEPAWLAGHAIVAASWRAIYQHLGYGAFGSDYYIDPAREPLPFLVRFPQAFVVLVQGALGGLPSDFWGAVRPSERWSWPRGRSSPRLYSSCSPIHCSAATRWLVFGARVSWGQSSQAPRLRLRTEPFSLPAWLGQGFWRSCSARR